MTEAEFVRGTFGVTRPASSLTIPRHLIGLTGHMGSGKDEAARTLISLGYVRIALSDALKSMARAIGWDGSKEDLAPCPHCGMLRGRALLQILGTEAVREHIDQEAWLKVAWREIQRHELVVVPDIRFENEAAWIREHLGEVWRVVRPGHFGDTHSSEREQEAITADRTIFNDSTIATLAWKVKVAANAT